MPTGYAECGALVVAADRDDAEELRRLHAFQRGARPRGRLAHPARRARPRARPLAAHRRRDPRAPGRPRSPARRGRRARRGLPAEGGELRAGAEVTGLPDRGRPRQRRRGGGRRDRRGRHRRGRRRRLEHRRRAGHRPVGARRAPGEGPAARAARAQRPPPAGAARDPHAALLHRHPRRRHGRDRRDRRRSRGSTPRSPPTASTACSRRPGRCCPTSASSSSPAPRAGLRPSTPDNAPAIGPGVDGLLWATGHHRNGVLLAPLTARAVTRADRRRRATGVGPAVRSRALRPARPVTRRSCSTASRKNLPDGATRRRRDRRRRRAGGRPRRRGRRSTARSSRARSGADAHSATASTSRCCTRFREDEGMSAFEIAGRTLRLAPDHRHGRLSQPRG